MSYSGPQTRVRTRSKTRPVEVPSPMWSLSTLREAGVPCREQDVHLCQSLEEGERRLLGLGEWNVLHSALVHSSLGPRWLPESSRWLLLHGKSQLAVQNLRKVAAMNGRKEEGERLTQEVGGMRGGKGRQFSVLLAASRCARI